MIRQILISICLAVTVRAGTFTDVTAAGFLIRSAAAWNEVETAYSERQILTYPSGMATNLYARPGVGMQRPARRVPVNSLQEGVSNMVYAGWYTGSNMPDSAVDLPVYTNFVEFALDAGLSTNGFRRATSYQREVDDWTNPDAAMWSRAGNGYGIAQVGDIIGPWLIDDLQRALARMDIAVMSGNWNSEGVTNTGFGASQNAGLTWSAAVGHVATNYPGTPYVGGSSPLSVYYGRYYYQSFSGSWRYWALVNSNFSKLRWNAGAEGTNSLAVIQALGGSLGYYAFAICSSVYSTGYVQQYDDNGTGLLQDYYTRFSDVTFAAGSTNQYYNSAWLNDSVATTIPAVCEEPDETTPQHVRGFQVTGEKILVRLNWSHTR